MNSFMRSNGTQHSSLQQVLRFSVVFATILLLSLPSFAQLNYGRIFGGVTDQTGGAIVGATVTVVDVARGINHPLMTDGSGEYSASSLLPGMYTVRVEAKGFKTEERQNIAVAVGQDLRVDVSLQPGEQTQTVTVTESLPLMQTTNAQLGETIEYQVLNDLPLNGREFEKLMIYQPGVRANGLDISVNGNRTDNNGWLFDGVDDINHLSASGPIVGGQQNFDEATILPIDMIQEVNVVEQPKAEFGWKPSTSVNVGLKSGTNSLHGTAFALGRDTAMDSRNQFLSHKVVDNFTQYGATVGGPIKKDKLFFFIGYEGQRYLVSSPRTTVIPTTADIPTGGACTGGVDCTDSIPDAIYDIIHNPKSPGVSALSQLSLNMAGCNQTPAVLATLAASAITCSPTQGLFPNSATTATGVNQYQIALNNQGGSDNGLAKIDYHPNDHNAINGEFFRAHGNIVLGSGGIQTYWRAEDPTPVGELARGVWVWTPNSSLVNEARFGFDRLGNPIAPYEGYFPGSGPNYATQYNFITGLPMPGSAPNPAVAPSCPQCGFPLVSISNSAGLGAATGQRALQTTYDGIDSVSYTYRKHLFKFGGEIHRTIFTGVGLETNGTGQISFGTAGVNAFSGATPLEDFIAGVPSAGNLLVGNIVVTTYYNRYAFYAQDDWRVTSRLTANLGLRWEYLAPMGALHNAEGNFAPGTPTGMVQLGVGGTNSLYTSQKDAFAPRIGLAWDVNGKGRTVVRAGGDLLYNTAISLLSFMVQNAALPQVPTGWNLLTGNNTVVPGPGNITVGNVVLNGNVSPALSQIPWAAGKPIFNGVGPSSLYCGNGVFTATVGPATVTPSPCTPFGIDPHFRTPYVTMWNLAVQQAITNDLSLTVAYVGTHGNLSAAFDVNQTTPGTATKTGVGSEQERRPYYSEYPYFGTIQVFEGRGATANYDALQVTLAQRPHHGLGFNAGYSLSHCLDDVDGERGFSLIDSTDPRRDYGDCTIQPFNHFTFTTTYAIPGIKSPGQILEGWQVNGVLDLVGGVPVSGTESSTDLSGTAHGDRWTLIGSPQAFDKVFGGVGTVPCFAQPGATGVNKGSFAGSCVNVLAGTTAAPWMNMPAACIAAAANEPTNPNVPNTGISSNATGLESLASFGCYAVGNSVIVPPAQGTFGNMTRGALLSAPVHEFDLSVSKQFTIKELITAQFKAEFFNIFNLPNYSSPGSNPSSPAAFGLSTSTPSSANPIIGEFGAREVQLTLHLAF